MTREEIVQGLYRGDGRAIKEAIKTLEQETCEDAISKASVFEILGNLMSIPYDFDRPINKDDVSESMDAIRALPPVTPTRKKGKWEYSGSYDVEGMLYCSCCKHEIDVSEGYFKYCPNCGCKMSEGEKE